MYSHQLETFLSVVKYGSFTKAARGEYITSSAIVQQINLLEKRLGCKLFVRTNHGVALTPAGEVLAEEAEDYIRHAKAISERMRKAAEHRSIRLGWSTGAEDPRFLSECLRYRDAHPGLEVVLTHIAGSAIDGLRQGDFDLCQYFECSFLAEYGYGFAHLYDAGQCIVVRAGHPLAGRERVTLEDLAGTEIVMLAEGILPDHDAFAELVAETGAAVKTKRFADYGFETQNYCYAKGVPFLGVESLRHVYAPLIAVPVAWDVPVRMGLIYREPAWNDLTALVGAISSAFGG
ncbi:MAG: LysR family transcriptional regulator [Clostridia bacterium]|nr:LysR family transcriptional regulator [Clostridia bacterium]